MNANELADYLDTFWQAKIFNEAAAMLRQQQAELEELNISFEVLRGINNKQQAEIDTLKKSLAESQQESLNWEDKYRSIT